MEKLWTTAEVARHLQITESEVEQLVRDGTLTGYRLGGKFLRFEPQQVKALKEVFTPDPGRAVGQVHRRNRWLERLRDFIYFYDFYLVSGFLLIGISLYLLSSG